MRPPLLKLPGQSEQVNTWAVFGRHGPWARWSFFDLFLLLFLACLACFVCSSAVTVGVGESVMCISEKVSMIIGPIVEVEPMVGEGEGKVECFVTSSWREGNTHPYRDVQTYHSSKWNWRTSSPPLLARHCWRNSATNPWVLDRVARETKSRAILIPSVRLLTYIQDPGKWLATYKLYNCSHTWWAHPAGMHTDCLVRCAIL